MNEQSVNNIYIFTVYICLAYNSVSVRLSVTCLKKMAINKNNVTDALHCKMTFVTTVESRCNERSFNISVFLR